MFEGFKVQGNILIKQREYIYPMSTYEYT